MYKILGADGKEYGPVTAEQFRQWLNEGRANAQTKVLVEGALEWRMVAEIPELATYLPISSTPPPMSPLGRTTAPGADTVRGPAICALVLSILNILASIGGIIWLAFQHKLPALAGMPEQNLELQRNLAMFVSIPANLVGLGLAVVCLFGAIQMMKLRSYGLAMTTAILMLIPCGNCCCLLNIGVGIWLLVVLSKPEVKAAFQ
jgi:hypothetical protein